MRSDDGDDDDDDDDDRVEDTDLHDARQRERVNALVALRVLTGWLVSWVSRSTSILINVEDIQDY